VRGAKLTVAGTAQSTQRLSAKAHVAVERASTAAEISGVELDVELGDLVLAEPATASTGEVKLRGTVAAVAQPGGVRADGVKLDSSFKLGGPRPTSGGLTVEAARLSVPGLDDFRGKPLTFAADVADVNIDHMAPARSSGRADLHVAYGAATIGGRVEGSAADLRWDLEGNAERIGPARALAFKSKGSYGKTIVQETTVDVGRVAASGTAVKSAHVAVSSSGTMRRQEAKIAAALDGLVVNGKGVGSPKLDVTVAGDLDKPRLELALKGTQPESDLTLFAEIDARRTVTWKIDGRFARLGALAPLLPAGPDYAQLGVRVKGGGVVSGVVRRVVNGVPELVADPATSARGRSSLELTVKDLGYKGAAETVADAGEISLKADATFGERRVASIDLSVPELAAVASGVHVAVKGLTARVDAALEKNGRADARLAVRVGSLKQSAFAAYPVENLAIDALVKGDPKADLSFEATVDNAGAGTKIAVTGQTDQRVQAALDAVPGRRSLGVDGKIEQRLDALDAAPELIRARGRVEIPFRVESGDLVLFNTRATVKLDGVSVELPGSKLAVRDVQGELPVFEEIVMGPNGAEMVGRGERGVYPQLRFSDQQPFLGSADYLSIGEVTYGTTRLGPLAGNMRLDRDVLALDQLEMAALGGKITGQALVEVRGPDTRVAFRGKVTGVRPSSGRAQGDRLDANAAFTIAPYRLGLEGRVEIVEIGKAHLLDLLDLWDPYHTDVAANRVRLGLKLGYPKQVRLKFLHGFASFAVELGGLAAAVRIDEIKGIPIGPALARFLAPLLEATP
jgi:translocation and assembly module TamB